MADLIKDDITAQMVVCPLVDTNYALVTTAIANPTITLIINNGSEVDLSSTATLTYAANMGGHKLVIPAAALTAAGRYCLCIKAAAIQNYNLDGLIVLPQSTFATAASIPTLAEINTEVDTAISEAALATASGLSSAVTSIRGAAGTETLDTLAADIAAISITGGSSAEQVIKSTYITLDASEKTITLASPYNTTTLEQILFIKNITTGDTIYDSNNPTKTPISVADGVLTYEYDGASIQDTDVLQILVNKV